MNGNSLVARVTIAIVTVLPEEFNAMRKLVDDTRKIEINGQDNVSYWVGTIPSADLRRRHRVVLTKLPETGNTAAAHACTNLVRSFPNVKLLLMVGTAAGKIDDRPGQHVRLGDIVVSTKGVVEYDHRDEYPNERRQRGPLLLPSPLLKNCAEALRTDGLEGNRPWEQLIARLQSQHLGQFDRPIDDPGQPTVHYDRIGSGDTAFSNLNPNDPLAQLYSVVAFDMETFGLAQSATEGRGWIAVRGISDYGDARRTKQWRNYASLAAATYTRTLLERCPPQGPRLLIGRTARVTLGSVSAGAFITLVIVVSILTQDADDPIQLTDRVTVANGQNRKTGEVATIEIPVQPPGRRYLELVMRADNPNRVGDCAHAAKFEVVAIVDGQLRPELPNQQSDKEIIVDLNGAQHSAKIEVTVDMPDDTCQVNLSVTKAVLRN